jgi:hypothetical protein
VTAGKQRLEIGMAESLFVSRAHVHLKPVFSQDPAAFWKSLAEYRENHEPYLTGFLSAIRNLLSLMPEASFFPLGRLPDYMDVANFIFLFSYERLQWVWDIDATLQLIDLCYVSSRHLKISAADYWKYFELPFHIARAGHDAGHFIDENEGIRPLNEKVRAEVERARQDLLAQFPMDSESVAVLNGEEKDLRAEVFSAVLRRRGMPFSSVSKLLIAHFLRGRIYIEPGDLHTIDLIGYARNIVTSKSEDAAVAQDLRQLILKCSADDAARKRFTAIEDYMRHYYHSFVYDPSWSDRLLPAVERRAA